ncbi:hypothetical protein KM043_016822 [Ampulex compressa]|nr:hypothetical protein KM043_016822 [Ampulex compressa]
MSFTYTQSDMRMSPYDATCIPMSIETSLESNWPMGPEPETHSRKRERQQRYRHRQCQTLQEQQQVIKNLQQQLKERERMGLPGQYHLPHGVMGLGGGGREYGRGTELQSLHKIYLHDLQLYNKLPSGTITFKELQDLSTERLKVLKLVERVALQNRTKSLSQRKVILTQELENCELFDFAKLINAPGAKSHTNVDLYIRRKDHVSHFILRSAFSFENQKREWLLKQEGRLFKLRYISLDNDGIKQFHLINGIHYTPISGREKATIRRCLETCFPTTNGCNIEFYKTNFTNVPSLIRKRKVFIHRGVAFLSQFQIISLLIIHFKRNLAAGFEYARESASKASTDPRFLDIFSKLPKYVRTQQYTFDVPVYTPLDSLDELSETSYPLCMRILHDTLRQKHHLTHGGRVQYSLFVKGIGVSLDDAIEFFRTEYTKKMDEETFRKRYRYNIRHLYGQEGKRADYEPFNCSKIMKSDVGYRDSHGCPFKHLDLPILKDKLINYKLRNSAVESIISLSKEGRYSLACNKYYETTHVCISEMVFDHPNVYFNESRKNIINDPELGMESELLEYE